MAAVATAVVAGGGAGGGSGSSPSHSYCNITNNSYLMGILEYNYYINFEQYFFILHFLKKMFLPVTW